MGFNPEKVSSEWSLFVPEVFSGVSRLFYRECAMLAQEVTTGHRKTHRLQYKNVTPNMLFSTDSAIQNM